MRVAVEVERGIASDADCDAPLVTGAAFLSASGGLVSASNLSTIT